MRWVSTLRGAFASLRFVAARLVLALCRFVAVRRVLASCRLVAVRRVLASSCSVALLASALWSGEASAQIVNVLQEASNVGGGTSGKLNAGTSWLNGNTESLELKGDGIVRHRHERHLWLLMAQAKYGEASGKAYLDQELSHARYRLQVSGPLQWEAFTQIDRNPFRRRVLRFLLGTGPRLQLLAGPSVWTAVGLAYMPEYERLRRDDFPDSGTERWRHRLSSYLTHVVALGRFKASTTVYLQPDMADWENVRAFGDLSVEYSLVESVSLAISHSLQLDTHPPDGVRPADLHRALSLAWTF